jgi:transcription initiation factor TFIID TATA-box-binding protein
MAVKKDTKVAKKDAKVVKKDLKIVNIVASASLNHDVPLIKLAEKLPNTEYNPEQFPGLVMRIKEPHASALIFGSGNIVCTGATSMVKLREAIKQIVKNVEKIGIKIKDTPRAKVQNLVAHGSIGMDLNLNYLAMELENTEYEPEQFPGLVYKLAGTRATFLLFSNGKIVCAGTRGEAALKEAVALLIKTLKDKKKS